MAGVHGAGLSVWMEVLIIKSNFGILISRQQWGGGPVPAVHHPLQQGFGVRAGHPDGRGRRHLPQNRGHLKDLVLPHRYAVRSILFYGLEEQVQIPGYSLARNPKSIVERKQPVECIIVVHSD